MTVRDARLADAGKWRAIMLEAAEEATQIVTTPQEVWSAAELAERLADADRDARAYLVAEREGGLAGVLRLVRGERVATRHTAELGLTVARVWRGRGVGTQLMEAAEARGRRWGVRKLALGVFSNNPRARALYERLGYRAEGERRGHYLVGGVLHDEVLMAKWLD